MKLSIRLQTVADNIGEFKKLVDIGSDHGQLPIYLKEKFPEQVICASEAQTMPFENLKKEIYNSQKDIEIYYSDGLKNIPEADVITICGMGGLLITKIITDTDYINKFKPKLIVEPQSNYKDVRLSLAKLNYKIIKEIYIEEKKKYYPIIIAIPGEEKQYTEEELLYGRYGLNNADSCLRQMLEHKYEVLKNVLSKKVEAKDILKIIERYYK